MNQLANRIEKLWYNTIVLISERNRLLTNGLIRMTLKTVMLKQRIQTEEITYVAIPFM